MPLQELRRPRDLDLPGTVREYNIVPASSEFEYQALNPSQLISYYDAMCVCQSLHTLDAYVIVENTCNSSS